MASSSLLLLLSVLVATTIGWSQGFNLETSHYSVHRGPAKSMFGYSVAEYRDKRAQGWLVVGAPKDRTDQFNVSRGGAVYKCDIYQDNACQPLGFDHESNNRIKSPNGTEPSQVIDQKSDQLFGATVAASTVDGGPILACAPKYHWFGISRQNTVANLRDAIGSCRLLSSNDNGSTSSVEFSPCRNNDTSGHHRQGMCQAGMSAALTKDGKRLFIGAPGSYYWQGQLFTGESRLRMLFVPQMIRSKDRNQADKLAPSMLSTGERPAEEDNSYLGYSVAVGDFTGVLGESGVAVGMPRGANLRGEVMLYDSTLRYHQKVTGEQMGAYFGYALAVGDIDGDDRDDLIVTAPFYSHLNDELASDKIETGRVYVFYQGSGPDRFRKFHTRDGDSNRGQFGLSVASLGDIDLDGYGDFVVGEPYGGPENRGAVHIYRGTKDGVEEKASQVIHSEQLVQPLQTFGWSVAGGLDLDQNKYPDLVVGAYESNAAAYFRARPVIDLTTTMDFVSNPQKELDLTSKECPLADGTSVTCAELRVCLLYSAQGTRSGQVHEFRVHLTLDAEKKNNPRLYFMDRENSNVIDWLVVTAEMKQSCRQFKVYVSQHLRDKLTPLDASMEVELAEPTTNQYRTRGSRDPKKQLTAVLGPKNTKRRVSLSIKKDCGSDNVCVPELDLKVQKNFDRYLLGSDKIIELEVGIANRGEDAFESTFKMQLPPGMDYINIENRPKDKKPQYADRGEFKYADIIVQCSAPKPANNNTLKCDIGNPFPQRSKIAFKLYLQPRTYAGMSPVYEIAMSVNSTNPESPESRRNNAYKVALPVYVETDIIVEGASKPYEVDYNLNNVPASGANNEVTSAVTNLEYSPLIVHNYTIRNNGPAEVLELVTSLIWQAEKFSGEVLMYLIEQPEVSNEALVRCESANADYLSVKTSIGRSNRTAAAEMQRTRYTRDIVDRLPLAKILEKEDEAAIFKGEHLCEMAQCVTLQCQIGPLRKDEEVSIAAKYRANVPAMKKANETERIRVSTKMLSIVTAQPFIGKPQERIMRSYEVSTVIVPTRPAQPAQPVSLWIIILAVCIGVLLLFLLILLLYKCGFFNRHRPSSGSPESQPLNRH
ncbi:integrin alpha-PS2-like [Trichogramma pretiosum]|uniref:integrin alpha-PS2-like n=1 Tax=Trichogramma pretiosum TaxID=7493 RepID=UPI0006C962AB|nr:integrin alpha-PS2-like [Trichogramma pretiosum]